MKELQRAMRQWDEDVEEEAVRLVKQGVPPYEAVGQARQIVSRRRYYEAQQSAREEQP
jgi:hypothetical protein